MQFIKQSAQPKKKVEVDSSHSSDSDKDRKVKSVIQRKKFRKSRKPAHQVLDPEQAARRSFIISRKEQIKNSHKLLNEKQAVTK
jgi:hypothetical protein